MNVMQLSWSDRHGGAAIAASRLNDALNRFGVQSTMISTSGFRDQHGMLHKTSSFDKLSGKISARLDQFPLHTYRKKDHPLFSPAIAPERTIRRLKRHTFDIAHLHWINNGFLKIESLRHIGQPLVWTLHDMWPFTGGCHYASNCTRYEDECGVCPQLGSDQSGDLSRRVVARKAAAWSNLKFVLVAPSNWLAAKARESRLFSRLHLEVIPNCLDTTLFAPSDRAAARARFGLPADAVVLLFGALGGRLDRRKGLNLLASALNDLAARARGRLFHLALFGSNDPSQSTDLPFPVTSLGLLTNQCDVARAYAAADVFVAPSLEDNLPNTVMEAASCGLPSVAFRIGGLTDLVAHGKTGYLAEPFNICDLSSGILWVVEDKNRHRDIGVAAREHVIRCYSPAVVAERYASLYAKVLGREK